MPESEDELTCLSELQASWGYRETLFQKTNQRSLQKAQIIIVAKGVTQRILAKEQCQCQPEEFRFSILHLMLNFTH